MVAIVLFGGAVPFDARDSSHGDGHLEHCGHDHGGIACAPGLKKSYCNQSWMEIRAQFSSFVVEIVEKDNMTPAAWLRLHFHDCMVHQRDVYWRAPSGKGDGLLPNYNYYFNLILHENSDLISDSESLARNLHEHDRDSDGFLHNCVELWETGLATVKTGNEESVREVSQSFKT